MIDCGRKAERWQAAFKKCVPITRVDKSLKITEGHSIALDPLVGSLLIPSKMIIPQTYYSNNGNFEVHTTK